MHEIECHKADALKLAILCRHKRLPTLTTGTSINMFIFSWLNKVHNNEDGNQIHAKRLLYRCTLSSRAHQSSRHLHSVAVKLRLVANVRRWICDDNTNEQNMLPYSAGVLG